MEQKKIYNNRYHVVNQIGSGGMAEVFLANDLYLNRKVALKLLKNKTTVDDLVSERFIQEVKAVSRIKNNNVVSVYDIFCENDQWCLVFELINGQTLKKYAKTKARLTVNETLEIFHAILSGVNACHKAGIIHRDLKPDNILIANNGAIKVADFGISVIDGYEIKKNENQIIGTMKYIAPEIIKLQPTTIQSDIYALGIILYELLTGSAPFISKNPRILALKHIKEPMTLISDIIPSIPQTIENVILKATQKDPAARYKDIIEMQTDLITCLDPQRKQEKRIETPKQLQGLHYQKKRIDQNLAIPFYLQKKVLISLLISIVLIISLLAIIIWKII